MSNNKFRRFSDQDALDEKGYINNKTTFLELVPKKGEFNFKFYSLKEIPSIKSSISRWNKTNGASKGMFVTYAIDRQKLRLYVKDVGAENAYVKKKDHPPLRGVVEAVPKSGTFAPSARTPYFHVILNGVEYVADDTPVSSKEVAEYLKISVNAVHCLCKKGKLPYAKQGRKNVYSLKIVQAVMFQCPIEE